MKNKEIKNIINTIRQIIKEEYNIPKTMDFVVGDEVYLKKGDGEPYGMVKKITDKNVYVIPHEKPNSYIAKKPEDLHIARDWHKYHEK